MRNSEYNTACEFKGDMLAYLYGEAKASDRTTFETHLAECDACTDEFAEIAFARVSVLEWQLGEFAELPTPKIVIPYEKAVQPSGIRAALAGLFALPGFGPAVAFAAVLVMVLGGYVVFYNNSGVNPQTVASGEIAPVQAPKVESASVSGTSVATVVPPVTNANIVQKRNSVIDRPVKAAATQRASRLNRTLTANTEPRQIKIEMPEVKKPSLTGLDDEDDKSLRLADLLDDDGV